MSIPVKPWERDFVGTPSVDQRVRLESSATLPTGMGSTRPVRLQQVPSVPARPWLGRSQPRFNSYGYGTSSPYMLGGYGNYGGYGSYGGYGGYGNYGGYGGHRSFGANRFGVQGPEDPENRFIQIAEEAARPAFDSIQSVVDAFGSVSFMLESTYQAVTHTFRAVLGIAEHLGQLRSVFAAINVFRLVRWAYRKLCQLLGIKTTASQESIWQDATSTGNSVPAGLAEPTAPKWPIFVYFTIVVSGPLLMWRLLKSLSLGNAATSKIWDPKMEQCSQFAVVLYPFTAQTDRELSINAGKMVGFAPNQYQTSWSSGWALVTADRRTAGLVPINYLQQVQYAPYAKQVPATGRVTVPSAAATTNKECTPQQNVNSLPLVTDISTPLTPDFTPVDSAPVLNQPAMIEGSGETVPVNESTSLKLDPVTASSSDALLMPAMPEVKPFDSVMRQGSVNSSQTVDIKGTEASNQQSHTACKAS